MPVGQPVGADFPPTTRRNRGPTEIRANFSQVSSAATGQVAPRSRGRFRPRASQSSPERQQQSLVEKFDPAAAEAVLPAAIEANDFRAAQAAGEANQEDRPVAQATQIAEIEGRDHRQQVLGQDGLLLLRRATLGAADSRQHGGDVPVRAVHWLAALGEIPHERREPPLDRADRAFRLPAAAGPRGAGGDVESDDLRIRGQGREVLPPRPGRIVSPIGGICFSRVVRTGRLGVVACAGGEVLQMAGPPR